MFVLKTQCMLVTRKNSLSKFAKANTKCGFTMQDGHLHFKEGTEVFIIHHNH